MKSANHIRTYGGPHPSCGSKINAYINPTEYSCTALAAELADLWVRYSTDKVLTPHTSSAYASGLRAFLGHCDLVSSTFPAPTLLSPELRSVLLSFDEKVMRTHAPSTAGRRQRYLRTLLRYASELNIDMSAPTTHWAATPAPMSLDDETYDLDEFSKEEAVRMRRAARRDMDACVERIASASDQNSQCVVLRRWVIDCLRSRRSNAEVAATLRGRSGWLEQLSRVCKITGVESLDYVQLARLAMTLVVPTRRELMAFFLQMAWATGREPETLRRLSLRDIDIDQTRITLHLTKARAAKLDTFVIPTDGSDGRLYSQVRNLIAVTDEARLIHESEYLWLAVVQPTGRVGVDRWHHSKYSLREYDADTGLGLSRPHDTRRIRKSAKAIRAIKGGSLLAAVDGDHTEKTYRKHYQHTASTMVAAARAIHDAQDRVVESALHLTVIPKLAKDVQVGELDEQVARSVTEIAAERPIERTLTVTGCRDRRGGPFTKKGELCLGPPLACIGCLNAVVTLDNLPRILLAKQHIEKLRDGADPNVFLQKWSRPLEWISAVLEKFSAREIDRARESSAELFIPISQRLSE